MTNPNAYAKCTECYFAIAPEGAWPPTIVAYINPLTGLVMVTNESGDDIKRKHPSVVRVSISRAREMMARQARQKVATDSVLAFAEYQIARHRFADDTTPVFRETSESERPKP